MKYYVLFIWGDVDPQEPIGPFATADERDEMALTIRQDEGDVIYQLDIDEDGIPFVFAYSNLFFEEAGP